jgi:SAM-dependent methyltransferase
MPTKRDQADPSKDSARVNQHFYHALWSQTRLSSPDRFNTWPLISGLLPNSPQRLEVGPGLRPRLPVSETHFIDIAAPVVDCLNEAGARARLGEVSALPYDDGRFDLVCAFDVLEHVGDDLSALAELSRVLKGDGVLILSVPLHEACWSDFDVLVGHVRRYQPARLEALLLRSGLEPEKSAAFGMQPGNPRLLRWGVWFLRHRRSAALFWYNWLLLPLGILFQKRLIFREGLRDTCAEAGVDEVVIVCRRSTSLPLPLRERGLSPVLS